MAKVALALFGKKIIWQSFTGFRKSEVEEVVVYQYDRAPTLLVKAIPYEGKAGMKTGHKAAAPDPLTSAITTRRCFWKDKADIDLLPSAMSNIQLLLSR